MTRPASLIVLSILILGLSLPAVFARNSSDLDKRNAPQGVLVLDGSPVHNVGELWLHTANWGAFGSRPGAAFPFSDAPSGVWPSGSATEHVYEGGLWVGAIRNGIPAVSTASFEYEFRPTQDPIDIVYRTSEGATGGNRLPSANADDDNDGQIDEDPLDGRDNDLDALIDEDFAGISDQMFSRWYTDDQPEATQIYPDHNPLGIMVRENSYQWEDDGFDDFVGHEYEITNIGTNVLEDMYIGIFADLDVGNRNTPDYWLNDVTGYQSLPTVCTANGAVSIEMGYVCDSSGGSCMGVLLLGHPTSAGDQAPPSVKWVTYASFNGNQSYQEGGDPTNDFERYELMSSQTIESDDNTPRDYRILLSVGPFQELLPGETVTFAIALVGMTSAFDVSAAASAAIAYRGQWFNVDGDPTTGVDGRETPVPGPVTVVVDSCVDNTPIDWQSQDPIWINDDCAQELLDQLRCSYTDEALYRTGIEGKEHRVRWWLPSQVPVPVFITQFVAYADRSGITLEWETYADEPVAGFKIYRSQGGGAMMPLVDGWLPSEIRTFTDASVILGKRYEYVLEAHAVSGWTGRSQPVSASLQSSSLVLQQNYPNPFNPETTISFTVPSRSQVVLSIYSADGKLVAKLVDQTIDAGVREVSWDGRDAAGEAVGSGVYFYRLTVDGRSVAKKMVLLK